MKFNEYSEILEIKYYRRKAKSKIPEHLQLKCYSLYFCEKILSVSPYILLNRRRSCSRLGSSHKN